MSRSDIATPSFGIPVMRIGHPMTPITVPYDTMYRYAMMQYALLTSD